MFDYYVKSSKILDMIFQMISNESFKSYGQQSHLNCWRPPAQAAEGKVLPVLEEHEAPKSAPGSPTSRASADSKETEVLYLSVNGVDIMAFSWAENSKNQKKPFLVWVRLVCQPGLGRNTFSVGLSGPPNKCLNGRPVSLAFTHSLEGHRVNF
jgi:hypothetical protein